jgi:hypothetical protein
MRYELDGMIEAVPIKGGADAETNALPFCIESEITSDERRREKLRTSLEMEYQQSLALLREQDAPRNSVDASGARPDYPISGHAASAPILVRDEKSC